MEETNEKQLNLFELMMIGIGQIIGSGIVVLLCIAIGMTGKGVAVSFFISNSYYNYSVNTSCSTWFSNT